MLESWIHHASQLDHCRQWAQEQGVQEWGLGDLGASKWAHERWRAVVSIISGASKSENWYRERHHPGFKWGVHQNVKKIDRANKGYCYKKAIFEKTALRASELHNFFHTSCTKKV
jgi:hypothetical protein